MQIQDDKTVIGKSLFKKETKIELFVSMKVELSTGIKNSCFPEYLLMGLFAGERGVIEGAFGTSGKFRVSIPGITGREGVA